MAWEMLKATGKLFYELFDCEVIDPLKQLAAEVAEPHVSRKIAERLKPNLNPKIPEDQKWYKVRLGVSEEQVGKFLGLPDAINGFKVTVKQASLMNYPTGVSWDERWSYHSKRLFEYRLDGEVCFKNQRVTYYRLYSKRGKEWYAEEAPPGYWIKERKKECDSDELGTIL